MLFVTLSISLFISLIASALIIRVEEKFSFSLTGGLRRGIQNGFGTPVSRLGGLAILFGSIAAAPFLPQELPSVPNYLWVFGLSCLPVFALGLVEDLTHRISAGVRLAGAVLSAFLISHHLDFALSSVQFFPLDFVLREYPYLVVPITCFALAGITHSFNIIDGMNGVSSGTALIIVLGFGWLCYQVGDPEILFLISILTGAIAGFFVFNYPRGKIFLGDCGAYLIGFWVGSLSVLIAMRHPNISKWFFFVSCSGPIFEVVITMFRRVLLNRTPLSLPDDMHMHHVLYKFFVKLNDEDKSSTGKRWQTNSRVAPFLWSYNIIAVTLALNFFSDSSILQSFSVLLFMIYSTWYILLARWISK